MIVQFFTPVVAIPIHGGIQLVSNGSRATLLRQQVNWSAVGWASLLLFPASMVGVVLATSIPAAAVRLIMAAFVLVLAWRPSVLRPDAGHRRSERSLVAVGAVSGFLNSTVGASGPVTSPFFRAVTATHAAFVATAAAAQVVAHSSKIVAFGLDGFPIGDYLGLIAIGAAGVTMGSLVGTRLLGGAGEAQLALLFKVVLTALALRMITQAVP
ncbi:MAG: TSUP family transporter [Actinomycetia bacterium]|nr:TSUP family transporter [Actinomycetes bacterium]